ncbi:NADP-dependent oxidoreductase domain-containing protein [Hypoxylon fragiforme]|uniref:NADP-dependent oxidoreductase domain-containing protein n=1 Tax=Hypoxylon fragiforme TaxID=63214 RepID=UPI0020C6B335|nr:NADP-dependent oxidoreductase domain-containing protein [Hypoxylon fragiforme]XP_049115411.1 NADP-dependent oxidoreductase domain-containing protein [Hypoxylon fragiforme]KAI2602712.1 NADP-dependent oxidoreductase domain-containing protein [Hypoxylon fragiforme]KAI2607011.1 NADP-dependent oxidoreductase domain-containing protein [Hypoxylon fragiforme]
MPPSPSSVFKPKCATGFGLMGMTWRPKHTPDAQAFAAMKKAIAQGATFWSSGDYYGMPEPSAGLALIRRYFEAHPEDASKVTLFIKSCVDFKTMRPTVKHDQVIACADACIKHLGGAKKIDILGPTRVDPNVPLEETLGALGELVAAGKIGGVGISEAGAQTIEKANAIYPLSLVEVEFSLWTPDLLTNGVAATAKKLDIPLVAYSPLGRGFLTGQIKSVDDIPEGDIRRRFDRFQPENFNKNLELVEKLKFFATKTGVTPAQLALAWIRAHNDSPQAGTIIPIPGATSPERVEENTKDVSLSAEEKAQLDEILASFKIQGGRYNAQLEGMLWR